MNEHKHEKAHEVDDIIKLAQEYDLDALTIVDGDFELSITRREPTTVHPHPSAVHVIPSNGAVMPTPSQAASEPAPVPQGNVITAPIIGVFYRASAPDAPPFIEVGDRVQVGQTLCILEAMKLMNEITSDYSGVVTAIHVENSDLVTIGQPLFTISSI